MTIIITDHDTNDNLNFETFEFEMPSFEHTIETGGDGLYSEVKKKVKTTKLVLFVNSNTDNNHRWGELRVHFDTDTWNRKEDSLIYTDKTFMDDLRGHLDVAGFCDHDVDYSEAGMQGNDYVSCDVGEEFIASWELVMWAESEIAGA